MKNYRKTSHTIFDIKYHIVWITKYRKSVLKGDVAKRVRELIREICMSNNVEIIKGHISKDHVHIFVSVPPYISVSKLVKMIKEKTSYKILSEYTMIKRQYWGQHFWGRGYFVASSGNVTDEVIKQYIENQEIKEKDDEFKIEEEL